MAVTEAATSSRWVAQARVVPRSDWRRASTTFSTAPQLERGREGRASLSVG
ncbi:MAG: hypothetical protein M0Z46_11335 [Actinomycetota bacterium]|jgi:hypothetical protein|nr:hypothetical protein [Actinomycetota bacterium]